MANDDEIVYFQLPNGDLVSNDPRFNADETRAKLLAASPNFGHAGFDPDEVRAQTVGGVEEGTPSSTLLTGRDIQRGDAREAEARGLSPENPEETPAPPDSNERVLEVRESKQSELEEGVSADALASKPYSEWPPKALTERVRELGLKPEGKKKSDFVAALESHDAEMRARG